MNKYDIYVYDLTNFVKDLDKHYDDIAEISIPCFYGACTINRGQYFNYNSNKFRVRTDEEEEE